VKREVKRRSSVGAIGLCPRSTKLTGARRSLKKRSAFCVSRESLRPKTWTCGGI
jgi:hypothetical protein